MQTASRVIEHIVLGDSLNSHCLLYYFTTHETFFHYGRLSVTIVSITNIIPTATKNDLFNILIYFLMNTCPRHCFFIACLPSLS